MREDLKLLDSWETPDQWSAIERRVPVDPPPEQRARGSRAAAALVAIVVAIAGVGFGLLVLGGLGGAPDPTPREPLEVQHLATTERTIDTGLRFPEGAVSGFGSVWVATGHADQAGGDLLRLNPETGDEQARIAMPALPGWEFGGGGIATGLGYVWVTGEDDDPASSAIYRVDPADDSVEAIAGVPGSDADIWVDETGIWVLAFPQRGMESMALYRLDPASGETDTVEVPTDWSQNVFASGGWLYVWGSTRGDAPAETLFKIDPSTAQIVDRSDPGGSGPDSPFAMTPSADRIWFFSGGVRALDGATGSQVVGPLEGFSEDQCCSSLIADGRGGVWVMKKQHDQSASVVHLDRDGNVVASSGPTLSKDANGIAATYDEGSASIWVVHYEDTVTRLGLEPAAP